MIKCDNCGFGHKTVEEMRACKPWPRNEARSEPLNIDRLWKQWSTGKVVAGYWSEDQIRDFGAFVRDAAIDAAAKCIREFDNDGDVVSRASQVAAILALKEGEVEACENKKSR